MMTCVDPIAMIPTIETCRMIILIRAIFRIVPSPLGVEIKKQALVVHVREELAQQLEDSDQQEQSNETLNSFGQDILDLSNFRPPVPYTFRSAIFFLC